LTPNFGFILLQLEVLYVLVSTDHRHFKDHFDSFLINFTSSNLRKKVLDFLGYPLVYVIRLGHYCEPFLLSRNAPNSSSVKRFFQKIDSELTICSRETMAERIRSRQFNADCWQLIDVDVPVGRRRTGGHIHSIYQLEYAII
jgi:hypothetical protein